MADPAAQSPFVSSSSSARPEPAGPACRGIGAASCADPLVSSSQPVSLFAASPAVSGGSPPPPREAFVPLSSSSSSSSPGGGAEPPKDSPGSPFELVLDRAAFDREYAGGGLSQIPEDRVCDFPAKPPPLPPPRGTTAGLPSHTSTGFPVCKPNPPGLCRQSCGTAAALEEVSKCVREMRSFTSEMLSWDWVERGDGPPPGADGPPPGEEGPPLGEEGPPPGEEGPPPSVNGAPPGDADSSGDSDDTVIEEPPPSSSGAPPGADVGPPRSEIISSSSSSSSPPQLEIGPKIAAPRPPEGDLERLRLREAGEEPPPRPPRACWLPPLAVQELVLWRDARRSGAVFGGSLALLLSLAAFSAVSVAAHAALALLGGTVSYRVYRAVVCALQKADEGHPFRTYLELDLTLSPEAFQSHAAAAMAHVNHGLRLLLRLFLVEDLVDSLKLAVAMWLLTHVGAVFNGITLLILADLLAFTVPPFYEKYKAQIDHYMNVAREQSKSLVEKVQAKVPGMAKKKPE